MTGNAVTIMQPHEQGALDAARRRIACRQSISSAHAAVLVATIERLTESPGRRDRYWQTEKAERALDGAS
jgi:hypothetical protein